MQGSITQGMEELRGQPGRGEESRLQRQEADTTAGQRKGRTEFPELRVPNGVSASLSGGWNHSGPVWQQMEWERYAAGKEGRRPRFSLSTSTIQCFLSSSDLRKATYKGQAPLI